jgi:hypothetical protein
MRTRGPARRLSWWLLALLVGAPASSACERADPVSLSDPWPAGLARPNSVSEAEALKAAGATWTDRQVRQFYLERVSAIGPADELAATRGDTLEMRAREAFTSRHDARMIARAMMQDPAAVAALQDRDRAKYGAPDGPSFEFLVERAAEKGLTGDAIYASIVESAQRTDAATNASMGL